MRWLAVLWLAMAALPAAAQEAAQDSAAVDASELEALVTTLEDDGERQALIARLEALIAVQRQLQAAETKGLGGHILDALSERVEQVGEQFSETATLLASLPAAFEALIASAADPAVRKRWLWMGFDIFVVLVLGWLMRTLVYRLLKPSREKLAVREGEGMAEAAVLFLGRVLYAYLPIATFAAVALAALPLMDPAATTRVIGLAIVYAVIFVQAITIATGLIFGAGTGREGIFGVTDATAYYIQIWVRRLTLVAVIGSVFAESALLLGLPAGAHAVLLKLVGLMVAALLVVVVLQNRQAVAETLRPRQGVMARLADIWHVPALLYIAIAYGAWALQTGTGFAFLARATGATAIVLALSVLTIRVTRLGFRHGLTLSGEMRGRYPGLEARANRYMGGLRRVVVGLIYLVSALLLIEVWFGGTLAWLAGEIGRALIGRLISIVLIVVAAAVIWELVNATVERLLSSTAPGTPGSRSARLHTLLPLVRNAARVVLGIIVTLTVLSELGINIAPLLAGAGIAGLAIGFGAQSLVKDVINGVFILLEDSMSVGDVVDVGSHSGVVEGMTVRTVRLRDLSGNVHIVPFGEVASVINMTKGFAYALIDVGVAYKEDVDQVFEVLKEIGAEMQADPELGPMILAPLEVLGLDSFGDSSVNIRVRLRTKPIKQWSVRREFHRRMKRTFDERGIEIPFPYRTLTFATPADSEIAAKAVAERRAPATVHVADAESEG